MTNKFDLVHNAHHKDILSMRVHPTNKDILFSACWDGLIKVWRMNGFALPMVQIAQIRSQYGCLWSFVFLNNRLVVGNHAGELLVYSIENLHDIVFLGRVVVRENGFVAQRANDEGAFYATDTGFMEVYKISEDRLVEGKEAEYLLGRNNKLEVLRKLFGIEDDRALLTLQGEKQTLSLTTGRDSSRSEK